MDFYIHLPLLIFNHSEGRKAQLATLQDKKGTDQSSRGLETFPTLRTIKQLNTLGERMGQK